jgi:two-component system, OmpR family, alkaline phosphatase synthesis response regulator PhoP
MSSKGKILLVDDDPDFLDLHTAVLKNNGYEVFTATSGQEGLARVRTEMPDAIILDLMMEKHDTGFLFSQKIKMDPLFKDIPILMVTSVAEATGCRFSLQDDGYWMKADDFLDKPVKPEVLLERLDNLLRKKRDSK